MRNPQGDRKRCYRCYRPQSSCMCPYIRPVDTATKFIILMHPKEYMKTKNGTGHLTHRSLHNAQLFIGIDFSDHEELNTLIDDPSHQAYLLYPGKESINLNDSAISDNHKTPLIIILDATWPCSKKMLRLSHNLRQLPRVSFSHSQPSQFHIKKQPEALCLSTIESTHKVLQLLTSNGDESLSPEQLQNFLTPFKKMVAYQVECAKNSQVRYKKIH